MNAARRKLIERANTLIGEAQDLLMRAEQEEREYFEGMPEAIQASEKGQRAEEVADMLEEAVGALADIALADPMA